MRIAFLSDIHANWEALSAVWEHLQTQSVDRIICLGDLVGYGVDANACCEWILQRCDLVLLGNHDECVAGGVAIEQFTGLARESLNWTRNEITPANRDALAALPLQVEEEGLLYVHATPFEPRSWYYLRERHYERGLEAAKDRIVFLGHTHVPMVIHRENGKITVMQNSALQGEIQLPSGLAALVNVGSVGQPRDRDPRACYAAYDTEQRTFRYHRVVYDVERTCDKIFTQGFPKSAGERLLYGR